MSSSDKSAERRAAFRVIDGGGSEAAAATPMIGTSGRAEEQRLAAAILLLSVVGLGITVKQCLDEMCERGDSEVEGDIVRYLVLKPAIERMGIRYVPADAEHDLARPGYFSLTWPGRLLRRHPELAGFRPETHQEMAFG